MEELKREIEYLDKRIILMQDEVAEIDRALSNRAVTSIRNIIQERGQRDDAERKRQAK